MKRYIVIIIALLGSLLGTNSYANTCPNLYLRNSELREAEGVLRVEFVGKVEGEAIPKQGALLITPKLMSQERALALPTICIVGSNKQRAAKRWVKLMNRSERAEFVAPDNMIGVSKRGSHNINYHHQTPYEEWMGEAKLVLYVESLLPANRGVLYALSMSERVELSPREPYIVQPKANYIAPEREQKTRQKQGQAFIDFKVGSSTIEPNYRRNPEELARVREALNEVTENPDVVVNGLYIEGYASPDGSYNTNKRLSQERAVAMRDYIVNSVGVPVAPSQIRVSSVAEDWQGLKVALEASDLKGRELLIDIIDGVEDIAQRKAKLKLQGALYNRLLRDFFPPLRRVEYQIDYSVRSYSLEETRQVIDRKNIGLLSQRELYDAAFDYGEGTSEFEKIMVDYTAQLYPDDTVARVNVAATLINRGEQTAAMRYLSQLEQSPLAWNNLGVVALLEGDLESAKSYFEKAKSAGVAEAQHNLGELEKKREDEIIQERYRR